MANQGGVNISGTVGNVGGDIIGGNQIVINIESPIGKISKEEIPPGPNNYMDKEHRFSISWPSDDWVPSSRMGAYQLADFDIVPSREFRLFWLFKVETQASFAIFKLQRPQGICVSWVRIDIFNKTYGMTMSNLSFFATLSTLVNASPPRFEIISQTLGSWDRGLWRPNEEKNTQMIYRNVDAPQGFQGITRLIRGDRQFYSINSPIFPPGAAYESLRQETNAILNSFTLLS